MKTVRDILQGYVKTGGEFGGEGAAVDEDAERARRASALDAQLAEESETATRLFYIWLVLLILVFAFMLTAAALHLGEPYVTLPLGGGALIWILTRVEAMWREVRLHNLVIRLARATTGNPKLHDEVIVLLAEALRVDQRVRERAAMAEVASRATTPALEGAKENRIAPPPNAEKALGPTKRPPRAKTSAAPKPAK